MTSVGMASQSCVFHILSDIAFFPTFPALICWGPGNLDEKKEKIKYLVAAHIQKLQAHWQIDQIYPNFTDFTLSIRRYLEFSDFLSA